MPFGVSFLDGLNAANDPSAQSQAMGQQPQSPYQSAIKVLSLRLPKFGNANGIAPQPLLQAQGGMGRQLSIAGQPVGMNSALGQQSMNPLMQAFAQMAGMGMPAAPSMPPQTPRIVPGLEQGVPALPSHVTRPSQQPSPDPDPNGVLRQVPGPITPYQDFPPYAGGLGQGPMSPYRQRLGDKYDFFR